LIQIHRGLDTFAPVISITVNALLHSGLPINQTLPQIVRILLSSLQLYGPDLILTACRSGLFDGQNLAWRTQ